MNRRRSSAAATTVAVLAALVAMTCGDAHADPAAHKAQRRSVPATASRSAPDTTGAIPAKAPSPPPPGDDTPLPPPFTLPKASRARMRACGHQWESMKQVGTTGDDIWRDFATRCLAGAEPATRIEGTIEQPAPRR